MTDNQEAEEIKRLREIFKVKLERIKDCEDALRFYSEHSNFGISPRVGTSDVTYQNVLKDDFEEADNDRKTLIAGKRAREYFRKFGNE